MLIDARRIPDGTVLTADLCIVGAGTAGIALAHRLTGTDIRVCLLESGGLGFDWQTQSLAEGDSIGMPYTGLETVQLRCFGGNTNVWGGWFRPLDPIDFAERPWVEASGWPFPRETLAPYYAAAHELCEVASSDYDLGGAVAQLADPRARLIPFDSAKLENSLYRFSPPTRFAQRYAEAIKRAANVDCLIHANVLRIETTGDARTATALAVGRLSGGSFTFTAKVFVLAAGAIENARLLLLSNDVVARGLGNQHDLVGRYFLDHPHTKRTVHLRDRASALGLYGTSFRDRGIGAGIALPAAVQERERLLNYRASIYPVYAGQESRGWQSFKNMALYVAPRWRSDPYQRFSLPFAQRDVSLARIGDVIREIDKVAIAAVSQLGKPDRLVASVVLESKLEQAPNRDSRVMLSHARDALGRNRVRLDWRVLPIDRRTVVRAEDIIDGELRRLGIGALAPVPAAEREEWPAGFTGGWHQIGTTRAHADPRRGVVDGQCRVHGMSNLFIAGASTFPTGGAVSPVPTILALALRLADYLAQEQSRPSPAIIGAEPQRADAVPGYGRSAAHDPGESALRHDRARERPARSTARVRDRTKDFGAAGMTGTAWIGQ